MRKRTTIYYLTAWAIYAVLTFALFPLFNSNVIFPAVALIGLGSWMYGRAAGFAICAGAIAHHYILYQHFADQYIYYNDRLTGPGLCVLLILLFGTLRNNLTAIKDANTELDVIVTERTEELKNLTNSLIIRAESVRAERGQDLHDGIGQQLTGIQLFSSSIADKLLEEANPSASLALSLSHRAQKTHGLVRRTARSLFPVKIQKTGLFSALNELASCLTDVTDNDFKVYADGDTDAIPEGIALQFFRIAQETSLFINSHTGASLVLAYLTATDDQISLRLEHDGESVFDKLLATNTGKLIAYRLNLIQGTLDFQLEIGPREALLFTARLTEGAR